MADGFIVRKGGVTTEQALAPTITEISTSDNTIVFTLKNNDTESAVILYETNDEVPDENSIELAGGATSGNLTITGLTVSPAILYASANVVGKVKSNITERSFTFTVVGYTAATGGTTLEYDDGGKRYRSHTFLEDGNFVVTTVGDNVDDRNKVDYLIIAGGAGGGLAGGGAGGYRTSNGTSGGLNPTTESKVTITVASHGIVVGSGGTGVANGSSQRGNSGVDSLALQITSAGGGGGGTGATFGAHNSGAVGGSGGGAWANGTGGAGTTGQGFAGRNGTGGAGGGGGGAGALGTTGVTPIGGNGGNGLANLLRTGLNETRGGGGGGLGENGTGGTGGIGGGANGVPSGTAPNATTNTGGGGGGGNPGGNGGSGIVVIRYEIAPSV